MSPNVFYFAFGKLQIMLRGIFRIVSNKTINIYFMRKPILLLGIAGCLSLTSAVAATTPSVSPVSNPWVIGQDTRIENPLCPQAMTEKSDANSNAFFSAKRNTPFKAAEEGDEYFAAAQSYKKGWIFVYTGGDIVSYPMSVKVDGDKVTINGLFNFAAQSTEWAAAEDFDFEGTYDKEAGTITVSTIPEFDKGTIVGTTQGGYYQEMLIAGEVDEYGQIETVDELVFNVIGDLEALYTDTSFGVMNCNPEGVIYGVGDIYRRFYATLPQSEPKLITFNEKVNMGTQYATMTLEDVLTVVNVSNAEVDYFVNVDSDVFSAANEIGTIKPLSSYDINVVFSPVEAGNFSADFTVEYEGIDDEPEPLNVTYEGTAIQMPDFAKIVKEGDFKFGTTIDFPFELATLNDGTLVAKSGIDDMVRGSSQFIVEFEVAAEDLATLSWKGECVITQPYSSAVGYFIDGSDTPAVSILESADISNSIQFGPGKHSIKFQCDGYSTMGAGEHYMYLYDLDLATTHAEADAVTVDNPELNLGNQLIKTDTGVEVMNNVIVRNLGTNPLTVISVAVSDAEHFSARVPSGVASLFETLPVEVSFKTLLPGKFSTTLDIVTSAGTVTAEVSVLVRKMADFSKIVVEGLNYITSFETSDTDPFEVEDDFAYNANTGEPDDVTTDSWFQINFTIPEGETAYLAWDGEVYGGIYDPDDPFAIDYGIVTVYNPWYGYYSVYTNEYDGNAGSILFSELAAEGDFAPALELGAGDGFVKFEYIKNGNGEITEEDIMMISYFGIYSNGSGVEKVTDNGDVVSTQIFDLSGMRLQQMQKGVNIVRSIYSDGSVKTRKVIVK